MHIIHENIHNSDYKFSFVGQRRLDNQDNGHNHHDDDASSMPIVLMENRTKIYYKINNTAQSS